jgi:hypothetical protein
VIVEVEMMFWVNVPDTDVVIEDVTSEVVEDVTVILLITEILIISVIVIVW